MENNTSPDQEPADEAPKKIKRKYVKKKDSSVSKLRKHAESISSEQAVPVIKDDKKCRLTPGHLKVMGNMMDEYLDCYAIVGFDLTGSPTIVIRVRSELEANAMAPLIEKFRDIYLKRLGLEDDLEPDDT